MVLKVDPGAVAAPPPDAPTADRVPGAASVRHVLARLSVLERRVRWRVEARRAGDPEPDDPLRGLYISEEQVDDLLAATGPAPPLDVTHEDTAVERWADGVEARGEVLRLRRLAATFALDPLEVELLLLAMAPDLDPRFERLYGYLHDDVTRRRGSIGLAFELLGLRFTDAGSRQRFLPESPLVGGHLLEIGDQERPFLTRTVRVPDRVTAHLLGDDTPTAEVAALEVEVPVVPVAEALAVTRAIAAGIAVVYVREGARTAGLAAGVAGLAGAELPCLCVDLARMGDAGTSREILADALREAALRGAGLVAGVIDDLVERDARLLDPVRHARVPVVLVGRRAWDAGWLTEVPATIVPGPLDHGRRERLWRDLVPLGSGLDAAAATVQFRLKPEQAVRAWQTAQRQAATAGRPVTAEDLQVGARLQNAGRLEHLAHRLTPVASVDDLVLPTRVTELLREIVQRARHRGTVLDDWKMGGRSDKGRGITSLFAGESGTGKTLSAEVVAHELGLDLYVIDLSTVVDKYIGETEKNLERIFDQAEDVNGILFFDEADALFGKRSDVSDARDRYANLEIAYLLQRMERFDGITVLATNLRANLDEAFTRRIDVLIDFPEPEEEDRLRLWELHLPPSLPREDDLDLDFLAKAFELSGGDIRNVTLAAAYAASVEGEPVSTETLVRATAREYRKLGRLVTESEFGPYYDLVTTRTTEEGAR
ncbi:AAA family ATPase [Nitriliruptor alkaliphilus]|uniref:AAA family ATPase n=1 Tax=Nitriliruptor alkaliphilus TaxID=427918 RepID=UPI0006987338|nr:ATP-binding protein [Nitriliruptor alkaliphilus]